MSIMRWIIRDTHARKYTRTQKQYSWNTLYSVHCTLCTVCSVRERDYTFWWNDIISTVKCPAVRRAERSLATGLWRARRRETQEAATALLAPNRSESEWAERKARRQSLSKRICMRMDSTNISWVLLRTPYRRKWEQ